jgi:L-serine/L-threonine ammonia-lyase
LPTTTPTSTIEKIAELGGTPIVHGRNWFEADAHARSLVAATPLGFYIPPFDHPSIWRGHATLVDELVADLSGSLPDVVIASVGGGGLFCGILQGLEEHGATTSTAIAVETTGTAKLAKSLKVDKVVVLEDVSGIATTLGCSNVCDGLWDGVKRWKNAVKSWVATDTQAARACVRFADEERCIVEAACGAALAAVYEPGVLKGLMAGRKPLTRDSIVVVVVCGGSNATVDVLANYRKTYC